MRLDEGSMMDLTMVTVTDNHCRVSICLDRSRTDVFGGLSVVIFIDDFYRESGWGL